MRTLISKHRCMLAALGLALVAARTMQAEATARTVQADATASIVFKGTSTLHDFEGTVATQPFTATFTEDPATGQLRVTATATLNVLDMNTDNKKRDKNMFKMFDQKNYNLITGSLSEAPVPATGTSSASLRLKIRDVEQDVTATLSDWNRNGEQASCKMAFKVSLKAFGLKPPSVMGVIRVGDTVNIECKIQGAVQ